MKVAMKMTTEMMMMMTTMMTMMMTTLKLLFRAMTTILTTTVTQRCINPLFPKKIPNSILQNTEKQYSKHPLIRTYFF